MRDRYLNARHVLPEDLYHWVQPYLAGRYVWFPKNDSEKREMRDDYILRLTKEGVSGVEIADRLLISVRHVRRILAKKKARARPMPSRANGDGN